MRHLLVCGSFILLALSLPLAVQGADGDIPDEEFHAHDCQDHRANGAREDKVYIIYPANKKKTTVYCYGMSENSSEETAWTVVQRRRDGTFEFNQQWRNYKRGFGPRETDHWIGNDAIYELTNNGPNNKYILRIEITSYDDPPVKRHADYFGFRIGNEGEKYKLYFTNYTGNAGDSLRFHKGMMFSTPDQDNDEWQAHNCANMLDSGWWFSNCGSANLNGQFYRGKFNPARDSPYRGGIWWFGIGDFFYSFQSLMMIRPVFDDYVPPGIIV